MLLVGMLDSPYVRRVAIAGTLLGLSFEHRSVSVFRHVEAFRAINPLVKAPTLVCDDGTVITDSLLILQQFEDEAGRSLRPREPAARRRDLSLTGIATVAADKAVAIEYERKRPEDRRDAAWLARVTSQLHAALALLDEAAGRGDLRGRDLTPGVIAAAVAWSFGRFIVPDVVEDDQAPALAALTAECEAWPVFRQWPIDRD